MRHSNSGSQALSHARPQSWSTLPSCACCSARPPISTPIRREDSVLSPPHWQTTGSPAALTQKHYTMPDMRPD